MAFCLHPGLGMSMRSWLSSAALSSTTTGQTVLVRTDKNLHKNDQWHDPTLPQNQDEITPNVVLYARFRRTDQCRLGSGLFVGY